MNLSIASTDVKLADPIRIDSSLTCDPSDALQPFLAHRQTVEAWTLLLPREDGQ
jgi:hypothetical protein